MRSTLGTPQVLDTKDAPKECIEEYQGIIAMANRVEGIQNLHMQINSLQKKDLKNGTIKIPHTTAEGKIVNKKVPLMDFFKTILTVDYGDQGGAVRLLLTKLRVLEGKEYIPYILSSHNLPAQVAKNILQEYTQGEQLGEFDTINQVDELLDHLVALESQSNGKNVASILVQNYEIAKQKKETKRMYAIEYIALSMNVNLETGSIITEQTQQLETLASEDITKATHRLLCEMDAEDHEIVPTYENTTYFLENFSQVGDGYRKQVLENFRILQEHYINTGTMSSKHKQIASVLTQVFLSDSRRYITLSEKLEKMQSGYEGGDKDQIVKEIQNTNYRMKIYQAIGNASTDTDIETLQTDYLATSDSFLITQRNTAEQQLPEQPNTILNRLDYKEYMSLNDSEFLSDAWISEVLGFKGGNVPGINRPVAGLKETVLYTKGGTFEQKKALLDRYLSIVEGQEGIQVVKYKQAMSEVLMQSKDDPTKPSLFALQLFAQDQLQKHGKLFESVEEGKTIGPCDTTVHPDYTSKTYPRNGYVSDAKELLEEVMQASDNSFDPIQFFRGWTDGLELEKVPVIGSVVSTGKILRVGDLYEKSKASNTPLKDYEELYLHANAVFGNMSEVDKGSGYAIGQGTQQSLTFMAEMALMSPALNAIKITTVGSEALLMKFADKIAEIGLKGIAATFINAPRTTYDVIKRMETHVGLGIDSMGNTLVQGQAGEDFLTACIGTILRAPVNYMIEIGGGTLFKNTITALKNISGNALQSLGGKQLVGRFFDDLLTGNFTPSQGFGVEMLESATFYSGVLPEMFEEYAQHMRENLLTDKNIFDTTIRQQVETLGVVSLIGGGFKAIRSGQTTFKTLLSQANTTKVVNTIKNNRESDTPLTHENALKQIGQYQRTHGIMSKEDTLAVYILLTGVTQEEVQPTEISRVDLSSLEGLPIGYNWERVKQNLNIENEEISDRDKQLKRQEGVNELLTHLGVQLSPQQKEQVYKVLWHAHTHFNQRQDRVFIPEALEAGVQIEKMTKDAKGNEIIYLKRHLGALDFLMPEQAEALAKLSMKSGLTGREGENVELSTTRINQIVTDIINQEPGSVSQKDRIASLIMNIHDNTSLASNIFLRGNELLAQLVYGFIQKGVHQELTDLYYRRLKFPETNSKILIIKKFSQYILQTYNDGGEIDTAAIEDLLANKRSVSIEILFDSFKSKYLEGLSLGEKEAIRSLCVQEWIPFITQYSINNASIDRAEALSSMIQTEAVQLNLMISIVSKSRSEIISMMNEPHFKDILYTLFSNTYVNDVTSQAHLESLVDYTLQKLGLGGDFIDGVGESISDCLNNGRAVEGFAKLGELYHMWKSIGLNDDSFIVCIHAITTDGLEYTINNVFEEGSPRYKLAEGILLALDSSYPDNDEDLNLENITLLFSETLPIDPSNIEYMDFRYFLGCRIIGIPYEVGTSIQNHSSSLSKEDNTILQNIGILPKTSIIDSTSAYLPYTVPQTSILFKNFFDDIIIQLQGLDRNTVIEDISGLTSINEITKAIKLNTGKISTQEKVSMVFGPLLSLAYQTPSSGINRNNTPEINSIPYNSLSNEVQQYLQEHFSASNTGVSSEAINQEFFSGTVSLQSIATVFYHALINNKSEVYNDMFGLVDNPSILIQVSRIISQIFGSDTQDVQNTIGNLERSQAFESDEIKTQRFDILLQQLEEEGSLSYLSKLTIPLDSYYQLYNYLVPQQGGQGNSDFIKYIQSTSLKTRLSWISIITEGKNNQKIQEAFETRTRDHTYTIQTVIQGVVSDKEYQILQELGIFDTPTIYEDSWVNERLEDLSPYTLEIELSIEKILEELQSLGITQGSVFENRNNFELFWELLPENMHVQDIYPQLVSKIKNMSDDSRLEIVRLILQNHLLKSDSELFQNILTVHNLQPGDSISRGEGSEQTTKIATVENSNRIKAQALHHFLKKEYTDDTQRSIVIRQLLEFGACGTAEYDNRCVRALPSFKESLSNKGGVIFENATHTVYTKVDQTYSSSLGFDGNSRNSYGIVNQSIQDIGTYMQELLDADSVSTHTQLSPKQFDTIKEKILKQFPFIKSMNYDSQGFLVVTVDKESLMSPNQPKMYIWTQEMIEEMYGLANELLPGSKKSSLDSETNEKMQQRDTIITYNNKPKGMSFQEYFDQGNPLVVHAMQTPSQKLAQSYLHFEGKRELLDASTPNLYTNPLAVSQRNTLSTSLISKEKLGTRAYFGVGVTGSSHSNILQTHITDGGTPPNSSSVETYKREKLISTEKMLEGGDHGHWNFYNELLLGNSDGNSLNSSFLRVKTIQGKPAVPEYIYDHLNRLASLYNLELVHIEQTNFPDDIANTDYKIESNENSISLNFRKNGIRYSIYSQYLYGGERQIDFSRRDPSGTNDILSLKDVEDMKSILVQELKENPEERLQLLHDTLIQEYQDYYIRNPRDGVHQVVIKVPGGSKAIYNIDQVLGVTVHELDVNEFMDTDGRPVTQQELEQLKYITGLILGVSSQKYSELKYAIDQAGIKEKYINFKDFDKHIDPYTGLVTASEVRLNEVDNELDTSDVRDSFLKVKETTSLGLKGIPSEFILEYLDSDINGFEDVDWSKYSGLVNDGLFIQCFSILTLVKSYHKEINICKYLNILYESDGIDFIKYDETGESNSIFMTTLGDISMYISEMQMNGVSKNEIRESLFVLLYHTFLLKSTNLSEIESLYPEGMRWSHYIGGGFNGVIFNGNNNVGNDVITKFSRYPNHGLIKEGEMHEAYSDKINTLKEKGIISKKFFVPKLIDYSDSLLIMKKANGKTLLRLNSERQLLEAGVSKKVLLEYVDVSDQRFFHLIKLQYPKKFEVLLGSNIEYDDYKKVFLAVGVNNKSLTLERIGKLYGEEAVHEYNEMNDQLIKAGFKNIDFFNPANVIIDPDGNRWLIDFGVAEINN